ncbi:MAG: insulinase family protein [Sphingomonadaceae bacterium]
MTFRALLSIALALSLSACAGQARLASAEPPQPEPTWAFEASDVPVDPAFRFGQLDNGMRYIVRQNATPAGTALVRMEIAAGSLDETDSELGYAHFVEHMAFNGSTNVPEGEMVRLLERNGLAFGADTNASTSFSQTTYKLDLPRNDPALLDVALMLMRETASELTISDEAVERERGVLLSEMRDRNTYALREALDSAEFMYPDARYPKRFPIGAAETLNAANGTNLRAFWEREYVPEQTTVVVVGDFDRELVEAAIRARFADWQARPPEPQPDAGPVDPRDKGRTDIYIDPALPERVEMVRNGAWLDDADTILQRQENLLRQIGYGIVNRRFLRIARAEDPPFRGAGFGTADVFEAGRVTRLIVDTSDRKWRTGMLAAVAEYRRAMANGFTDGEVAEQVANTRTQIEDAAASADTRSHGALVNAAFALVRDDQVPSTPASVLERFNACVGKIEPAAVLAALKREAVELVDPLIRFRGRFARRREGLRAAWKEAVRQPIPDEANSETAAFAYTDFGTPGTVVSDTTGSLGIRTLHFTPLVSQQADRSRTRPHPPEPCHRRREMLDTRENPLATEMMSYFAAGGLGQHSQDDLDTVLAGKSVYAGLRADVDTFSAQALTTPRDETQAQLRRLRHRPRLPPRGRGAVSPCVQPLFAQLRATPSSALRAEISGILSDGDPRFTLQDPAEYRALTMAGLRDAISERLANGAIEISVVGDQSR